MLLYLFLCLICFSHADRVLLPGTEHLFSEHRTFVPAGYQYSFATSTYTLDLSINAVTSNNVHLINSEYFSNNLLSRNSLYKEGDFLVSKNSFFLVSNCDQLYCSTSPVSPLSLFSSLKFSYNLHDTLKEIFLNFNYDPKTKSAIETFKFDNGIEFTDTFAYLKTKFQVEFDFNALEGIKSASFKIISEFNGSIGLQTPEFNDYFESLLFKKLVASYILPIFFIPIELDFFLAVSSFVNVVGSPFSFNLYFGNNNIIAGAEYSPSSGLVFSTIYDTFETDFRYKFDNSLSLISGINISLTLSIAGAVDLSSTLTPYFGGKFIPEICPNSTFIELDFGLDYSAGMSDINFEILGRKFMVPTNQLYFVPIFNHNFYRSCSNSKTFSEISALIPSSSSESFTVKIVLKRTDSKVNLDKLYLFVNSISSDYCAVSQDGSYCEFSDYFSIKKDSLFSFDLFRTVYILFWKTIYSGNVFISSQDPVVLTTKLGFDILFNPVKSSTVELNQRVLIGLEAQNDVILSISEPSFDFILSDYILVSDLIPEIFVEIFAGRSLTSRQSDLESLGDLRGKKFPVPTSRFQIVTYNCSENFSSLSLKFSKGQTISGLSEPFGTFSHFLKNPQSQMIGLYESGTVFDTEIVTLSVDYSSTGIISHSGTTKNSQCTMTSSVFYPSIFLKSSSHVITNFSFAISKDISKIRGKFSVNSGDVLSFQSNFDGDRFYQILGKWLNVINEAKISEKAMFITQPATIISPINQTVEIFEYFLSNFFNEYSLSKFQRLVIPIVLNPNTAAQLNFPNDLLASFALIDSENLFNSSIILPAPKYKKSITVQNSLLNVENFVLIFACQHENCYGNIKVPIYSQLLNTGTEVNLIPNGKTFFKEPQCNDCLVYYRLLDNWAQIFVHDVVLRQKSGHFFSENCEFSTLVSGISSSSVSLTPYCIQDNLVNIPAKSSVLVTLNISTSSLVYFYNLSLTESQLNSVDLENSIYSGINSVGFVDENSLFAKISARNIGFSGELIVLPLVSKPKVSCLPLTSRELNCTTSYPNQFVSSFVHYTFIRDFISFDPPNVILSSNISNPNEIKLSLLNPISRSTIVFSRNLFISNFGDVKIKIRFYLPHYIVIIGVVLILFGIITVICVSRRCFKSRRLIQSSRSNGAQYFLFSAQV
ncbi:hypothetical protein RCL1_000931 [Eukaryota sp. TZLM3-RCL]